MVGCTIGETFKIKQNRLEQGKWSYNTQREGTTHTALYQGSGLKGQGGKEQVPKIVLA